MMISALNRLYRRLFCFGGYGVHSPFVFRLITEVLEEKSAYYCYERLANVRRQLSQNNGKIRVNNRELAVNKALSNYCFTEAEDKLLFRLANRFQPEMIYTVGSDLGLTPLYLTAYSKKTHCIVFEPESSVASVAQKIMDKYASARIDMGAMSPAMLCVPNNRIDFVVIGKIRPDIFDDKSNPFGKLSVDIFKNFLPYMNNDSVMIIAGIHATRENCEVWKSIGCFPEVSVTLDLYDLGIVFFNPKLHRRMYKSFVL
ncbi:hypothetical protein LJC72_11240 [Bacteroides sp. OttesenSCG-928-D19]|nr:hypothetical protein [Bacteroides sp. OttesenSCG-928-D19]